MCEVLTISNRHFSSLAEAHPQAVITLTDQYRMNKEIMEISNRLIYDQRLRCGSESCANGRLKLLGSFTHHPGWLQRCLSPESPVVFIDTDSMKCIENGFSLEGKNSKLGEIVNPYEVSIVKLLHDAFLRFIF